MKKVYMPPATTVTATKAEKLLTISLGEQTNMNVYNPKEELAAEEALVRERLEAEGELPTEADTWNNGLW